MVKRRLGVLAAEEQLPGVALQHPLHERRLEAARLDLADLGADLAAGASDP